MYNINKKNGMWKGNKASLRAIHLWVIRRKPKPQLCEECKLNKPYDLANISDEYKRDIKDFRWLCRNCHKKEHDIKAFRTIVKKCLVCKIKFKSPKHHKQKYCSKECADKAHHIDNGHYKICKICKKEFWAINYHLNKGHGLYCSNVCYHKSRINKVSVKCLNCNKSFDIIPAKLKRGEGKYCCVRCYREWVKK